MQTVVGVRLQYVAAAVLDLHQPFPGVKDELPTRLVLRQVAVGIVGRRGRPADAGDLVLGVVASRLRVAVAFSGDERLSQGVAQGWLLLPESGHTYSRNTPPGHTHDIVRFQPVASGGRDAEESLRDSNRRIWSQSKK
ncbi:MAG: hypothetical protein RMI91_12065 [Gemmatales bacterium]|nr:hypothetical protein [Gemmatales bacterium]MDW7995376.1 hypothetical protein [Gemmatales bacterium]